VESDEHPQRILNTLRRHGVSLPEYAVLSVVSYRIPVLPAEVAWYAKYYSYDDRDIYGVYELDDYLRAIDQCIARSWLTILTPEHFEREVRRLGQSPLPEIMDTCYGPGAVDFTEAGFYFHRQLLTEMFGPAFLEQDYYGCNWDEGRTTLDFYATDEDRCREWLEAIGQDITKFLTGPARVVGVEEPRPIGPWKPDRFLTLPSGFHAAARVELLGEMTHEGGQFRARPLARSPLGGTRQSRSAKGKARPMNESEWQSCTDPQEMLAFLCETERATDRKLRLFAVACCRRVWTLMDDDRSRAVVEATERCADGLNNGEGLRTAVLAAQKAADSIRRRLGPATHQAAAGRAAQALGKPPVRAAEQAARHAMWAEHWEGPRTSPAGQSEHPREMRRQITHSLERVGQCQTSFLHDLFGNPFRPLPPPDPAWLAWNNGLVLRLAEAAYQERQLPAGTLDPELLAVLAGALEEAGCTDADLLGHLRGPGLHVRGCHVIDLLLGKS
jgi:hypothetical protein